MGAENHVTLTHSHPSISACLTAAKSALKKQKQKHARRAFSLRSQEPLKYSHVWLISVGLFVSNFEPAVAARSSFTLLRLERKELTHTEMSA
jgi:hypothetical protein